MQPLGCPVHLIRDPLNPLGGLMGASLNGTLLGQMVPNFQYPLEEEMATHSSILAWRIPWTEEPGG